MVQNKAKLAAMPKGFRLSRALPALLLLWSATLWSCSNSGANSSTDSGVAQAEKSKPSPAPDVLPGVDTSKLDNDAKTMLSSLVNNLLSPCGDASSLARCVVQKQHCNKCLPAAHFVMRLVDGGFTREEINQAYRTRYDDAGKTMLAEHDAPSYGATMAPVTLQVFSDFQCPHCRVAAPLLHQLADEFPGKVRVVYRHFPLNAHPLARSAARAGVAAQLQGKFWSMHDLLFEHQDELSEEKIVGLAKEAGLDMKRFKKDYASKETDERVSLDRKEGEAAGIQGTPTIFVNGRKYELPFEDLPDYIKEELGD